VDRESVRRVVRKMRACCAVTSPVA